MSPLPITLFVPCLVDQLYPQIAFAAVSVLQRLGYTVEYAAEAVCCGQPAFNSGDHAAARPVAHNCLSVLGAVDGPIVCLSGSCTAMVRNFFSDLLKGEPAADEVGARVFEFGEFLHREGGDARLGGRASGKVGFHNSCHSCRELGLRDYAAILRRAVSGCEFVEPATVPGGEPVCCGFGGLFCVKFPKFAESMALTRLEMFLDAKVSSIVSNDPGCMMQLRKEAEIRGAGIEILHVAEFLDRSAPAAARGAAA